MTTANNEFDDLMPHRIKVTGTGVEYDDYGDVENEGDSRIYICLLDDTTTTQRTADGTTITIAFTAYVAPVPIFPEGSSEPVDIGSDESVEIIEPYKKKVKIHSVERHYDADNGVGMLHNIVLRFQ